MGAMISKNTITRMAENFSGLCPVNLYYVVPVRLELTTFRVKAGRANQLCYGTERVTEQTRTADLRSHNPVL